MSAGRKPKNGNKPMKDNNFLALYNDALPELASKNLRLQDRALVRLEETIDTANPLQAATIYGILSDKMRAIAGNQGGGDQTFNMYFGENMSTQDMTDLMGKVMSRINGGDVVDAEFEVVDQEKK